VAAASRTTTSQQNLIRHLTTSRLTRMSDDGNKQRDDAEQLKQRLSEMEYAVTQLKHTEP